MAIRDTFATAAARIFRCRLAILRRQQPMLEPINHPWFLRIADAAHRPFELVGRPLLPCDPDSLKDRARRLAGLGDFGDPAFEEGLRVLCNSADRDAKLNFVGRLIFREYTVAALVQRLRRVDLGKRRPEIFERSLNRPLILVGLPRSGTTMLHRLLALAGDARALRAWELRQPIAPRGPDRRREEAIAMIAKMKRAAPSLDAKHHMDADEPEECMLLKDPSFVSISYWAFFPVFEHLAWVERQDHRAAYREYRAYLQVFQAESPERRLVLKAPAHTRFIELLHEIVPEARIVQTHRDPVSVVASLNSLFYTFHSVASRAPDLRRMARANLELLAKQVEGNMAQRARVPAEKLFDLRYRDLLADPVGSVEQIHARFDLPYDDAARDAVRAWLRNRPQHHFGKHVYSAAELGLSEEQINERFTAYVDRFLAD